jgi:hypothetical protein
VDELVKNLDKNERRVRRVVALFIVVAVVVLIALRMSQ